MVFVATVILGQYIVLNMVLAVVLSVDTLGTQIQNQEVRVRMIVIFEKTMLRSVLNTWKAFTDGLRVIEKPLLKQWVSEVLQVEYEDEAEARAKGKGKGRVKRKGKEVVNFEDVMMDPTTLCLLLKEVLQHIHSDQELSVLAPTPKADSYKNLKSRSFSQEVKARSKATGMGHGGTVQAPLQARATRTATRTTITPRFT